MKNINVLVRSCGELTEERVVSDLIEWFGKDSVSQLKGITPHYKLIEQTVVSASRTEAKWTLVVDADVLLAKNKLFEFLKEANRIADLYTKEAKCSLFVLLPDVYDNFMQKSRSAGVHLYYTENVKESLHYVENKGLRAETLLARKMSERGYVSLFVKITVGIHDFYQDYVDIVAKGILHSRKHSDITSLIQYKWKPIQDDNLEIYWLLKGIEIGQKKEHDIGFKNDRNYIYQLIRGENLSCPVRVLESDEEMDKAISYYTSLVAFEEFKSINTCFDWKNIRNEFYKLNFVADLRKIKKRVFK